MRVRLSSLHFSGENKVAGKSLSLGSNFPLSFNGPWVGMVKTPACHAGDEGIVTPTGRHFMGVGVGTQGGLINLSAADYRSRPDSISGTPTN